jgi:1-deoxy-D-xylulose-5-phosphate synthase
MDAALHRCPVTLVLDRAGVTGDDGPSHNGMWDLSIFQVVPGLHIAAPRDGRRLKELLDEAVAVSDAPTLVRFPKGAVPEDILTKAVVAGMDILHRGDDEDILIVSVGAMAPLCLGVAALLERHGYGVTVVDPRWLKPINVALPTLAERHSLVVTVEDNGRVGGFGATLARAIADADVPTPVRVFGLPQDFLEHGARDDVLESSGLTVQTIARQVVEEITRLREPAQSFESR